MKRLPAAFLLGSLVLQPGPGQTEEIGGQLPAPVVSSDFPSLDPLQVAVGRLLFFDPILSGNRNIACATCHHPSLGTSDGMSLSIGEGAQGLGPDRAEVPGVRLHQRIPRNAPVLWNKGARQFTVMFHDGRLERDDRAPFGFRMPGGHELDRAVPNALAAQAILPLVAAHEMAGQEGENEIADAVVDRRIHGPAGAWAMLSRRLEVIPEYRRAFDWIIGPDKMIHITDVGTSIAAFIQFEFRSTDSPFDRFLAGDQAALSDTQRRGLDLFYGRAGCSACHAGIFQTDLAFHAIGMPQIGPGKGSAEAPYADQGRFLASRDPRDKYRFLTPTLRNVTLTGPYGHAGAYTDLRAVIEHHLTPIERLLDYDVSQARLHALAEPPVDTAALDDVRELVRIAAAVDLDPVPLSAGDIDDLLAFLTALEDPIARTGRLGIPSRVPSGLPLDPLPAPAPVATTSPEERPVRQAAQELSPDRPAAPQDNIRLNAVLAADGVNLRVGPGVGYRVVASLPRGTRVGVLGRARAGWVEITTATGEQGYLFSRYLRRAP